MKNLPPVPFFASALALIVIGVLTTLNLTCPVCGGTGYLKAAQGLTLSDSSIRLIKDAPVYTFGECGMPLRMEKFTYAVNMTFINTGNQESKGTVTVEFTRQGVGTQWVQDQEGNLVEQTYRPPTVPAYVDVPAGTTKNIQTELTFIDTPLLPDEAGPEAKVTSGEDLQDPTCGGGGVLTFVQWIGAKLKPPSFQ